jgi:peroxiredoxin
VASPPQEDAEQRMLGAAPGVPALGRGPATEGDHSRREYDHPAAGWGAARSVGEVLERAGEPLEGFRALFVMNRLRVNGACSVDGSLLWSASLVISSTCGHPGLTRNSSSVLLVPIRSARHNSDITIRGLNPMTATRSHTPTTPHCGIKPGERAPELAVDLVGGGRWRLGEQQPVNFTMVVFYRGLHCPVCRAQLSELNRRLGDLESRGVIVIAVSGDTRERAERSVQDWHLDQLTIGYGLNEETARAFGLFISRGISEDEPAASANQGSFSSGPAAPSTTRRSIRCRGDDPASTTSSRHRLHQRTPLPRPWRSLNRPIT